MAIPNNNRLMEKNHKNKQPEQAYQPKTDNNKQKATPPSQKKKNHSHSQARFAICHHVTMHF